MTCAGSASSSAYRFWSGSSSATHGVGDRALERAVGGDALGRTAARRQDLEEVGHSRLGPRSAAYGVRAGLAVGDRAGDLAADDVGRVEQPDHARAVGAALAHLAVGSARSITRAPAAGVVISGTVNT